MEFDLKGKMADVAGDTLKNVGDSNGKLSNENTESAQELTNKTTRVALETGKAVGDKLVNKSKEAPETNTQAANRILLHEDNATELAGATLHTSDGRSKLMTASRRQRMRDKQEVNDIKLRDNRKKLQEKLRQQYEIKATVKGGLKTDLQVEVGAESKMHESSKYAGILNAASFGKRTLHMADNMANDEKGLGIQNAWTDTASKTSDAVSTVYTISNTAKYWRMQKNEKEIAKLLKQEDKIARNSIKMEYRTALERAKESDLWKNSNLYDRHLQKKAVKRKYMKNAIKEYQNAKKANSAAVTFTTGFNPMDKLKQGAGKLWEAVKALFSSPVGKIVIVFMLVLALMLSFLGVAAPMLLLSFGGDSDFSSPQVEGTGFPAEVEAWRSWVTERCKANNDASSGIDLNDYVNAILATIQQESGGISSSSGGDLMQCKESGLWDDAAMPSDWTTEQKSIDIGIRVFYGNMKTWGVDGADDYDNLQIVAQAYNYGGAFLGFMKRKNAKKWTLALSTEYSNAMAQQSGWSSYGHKEYGEEWLAKYQSGGSVGGGAVVQAKGPTGVMQTAQNQIGITENPPGSNNVVFNTDYYGQEVSGDAYPWCCVFVWWLFNKSGNGAAFYDGGKVASCDAVYRWAQNNGLFISGSEAKYGDIVLFGNNEHIEVVVSNNGDGTYTTIGGNTSSDGTGSQSNGGCVALKTRYTTGGFRITSFIRPNY